uniref:Large ribosomal subunit protein mL54 n=1 Tax=Pinguiococcus pyrenoidosus TaxID=172671 RepID=A0A7R9YEM7_9STRA|mmetsp:Transcript_5470/g.21629  ORF Transcript_5470/g.21629 Transcript_5470/m.21629 type:complete len:118 (+) Transcript_5470:63-416(+)
MSSGLLCLRGRLAVAVRHGPSAARWRHVGGFRRSMSKETKVGDVVPIKFLKEQEEIKIMEDDQYPEWLWELPQPGIKALTKKLHENFDELSVDELQRLVKLRRRQKIREHNLRNKTK